MIEWPNYSSLSRSIKSNIIYHFHCELFVTRILTTIYILMANENNNKETKRENARIWNGV